MSLGMPTLQVSFAGQLMADFRLAISGCWIYYLIFWLVAATKTKAAAQRQSWASFLLHSAFIWAGAVLLSYDIVPWGFGRQLVHPTLTVVALAAGTTLAGLLVAVWARCILGRNWSGTVAIKEGHELVQHGPYHWTRNPIYSGMLLMIVGTGAMTCEVRDVVAVALVFIGFWIKIRKEETLMLQQFPAQFPDYRSRVKSLIPFVF